MNEAFKIQHSWVNHYFFTETDIDQESTYESITKDSIQYLEKRKTAVFNYIPKKRKELIKDHIGWSKKHRKDIKKILTLLKNVRGLELIDVSDRDINSNPLPS